MARARRAAASKKGTVKVNFKDIETRTRVNKEGDYPLKVLEAVSGKSSSGNDQIEVTLEVTKGDSKGAKAWMYFPLIENSLWKLHAFLTALGVEVPDDEFEVDLSEMVDQEIMGVFTPDTYNGKRSFKMTDFASIDDYKGDDDDDEDEKPKGKSGKTPAKGKKKVEKPDYEDLDEDELIAEYVKRKIGTKKAASKLDEDELREALVEHDEENADEDDEDEKPAAKGKRGAKSKASDDDDDDEDEKPAKGKKKAPAKKKAKKLDREEVEDMDEDELEELITEHDLDVDLDKYKKLPKKVAAVIEALEEEDLLDD